MTASKWSQKHKKKQVAKERKTRIDVLFLDGVRHTVATSIAEKLGGIVLLETRIEQGHVSRTSQEKETNVLVRKNLQVAEHDEIARSFQVVSILFQIDVEHC